MYYHEASQHRQELDRASRQHIYNSKLSIHPLDVFDLDSYLFLSCAPISLWSFPSPMSSAVKEIYDHFCISQQWIMENYRMYVVVWVSLGAFLVLIGGASQSRRNPIVRIGGLADHGEGLSQSCSLGLGNSYTVELTGSKVKRGVAVAFAASHILANSLIMPARASTGPVDPPGAVAPSDADNRLVQMAFKDYNDRRFDASDKEFSLSIKKWDELNRPRDEKVALLTSRANVRTDNKDFQRAVEDFEKALLLMKPDGEKADGTATYPEYPDAFVGRALAYEGLSMWEEALKDYDKAISLWGGGKGDNVNPYVLNYRGNVLTRLNRVKEAVVDYTASVTLFSEQRDIARASDAKANLALALYSLGEEEEAVKAMKDVIRKNPGYGDMHVALAADSWGRGKYIDALNEWKFTCDRISSGCDAYKDEDWVVRVRRWPPSLAEKLKQFLGREIPAALKGEAAGGLAPATPR
jgi:tetratricopeptide (TPR) repeat protein